jgi:Ser-tRNA(Ala) deacylase AlaX
MQYTEVTDVREKDGEIVHHTEVALEVGSEVTGKIDWERRFDLMQQHSGEHIVSGLVHEAYGYDNVGFHMSSDVITVDLSGVLTEAQLAEIEAKTNQKICPSVHANEVLRHRPNGEYTPKSSVFLFNAGFCIGNTVFSSP